MHNVLARKDEIYPLPLVAKYFPSSVEHRFGGLLFSMPLQGQYYFNMLSTLGHLEKLPFRPISASQENEKCSHMTNMLRFFIFLFLDLERKI